MFVTLSTFIYTYICNVHPISTPMISQLDPFRPLRPFSVLLRALGYYYWQLLKLNPALLASPITIVMRIWSDRRGAVNQCLY